MMMTMKRWMNIVGNGRRGKTTKEDRSVWKRINTSFDPEHLSRISGTQTRLCVVDGTSYLVSHAPSSTSPKVSVLCHDSWDENEGVWHVETSLGERSISVCSKKRL